ncbi:phenylacetic acid degradation protein PaaN [Pontibacter cellulosilyticus]|uniref:Phenylacetic acid degradation protein PaaN n=1 Tax=Pontibacter cellulosilyticus TaxID=1720253 RepID=A0A923N4N9_9BACT|nr:phenylacetic acid degradation protein PaaN [Pontibacter cellulosilyticus]MBC5992473.1 phenylacetic acid degradation protein PaaN [Pontibacter cellulosilyticus]
MKLNLLNKHQDALNTAIKALHERTFYARYPENPSPEVYGENADKEGREKYKSHLNEKFDELLQQEPEQWVGQEDSPYEQQPLNIKYPYFAPETLVNRAEEAYHQWRKVKPADRAAILVESLERMKERFFEIAYATMHTTGQAYMMSFQASGPHAADRALEAVAAGLEEQTRFPETTEWEKPMGKYNLKLNKTWKAVPKGVALVIGCSTFPTWNTVPGMYASLVTGNPVIVKPHPKAVLPIAIVVAEVQKVLQENGLNPNICQLAVDADDHLITKELAENPKVKLIDYTGGTEFGNYVESLPGKTTFTEKTGVNSIIIDSVEDLDKVAQNLAFSVSLYSGQMCTAPQNFFIPEGGVKVAGGETVPFEEVVRKISDAVSGLVNNPKAGPHVLGAIQNPATSERVKSAASIKGKEVLSTCDFSNPMFANARTCTPVIYEVDATEKESYSRELFGPIMLIIKTKDTNQSVELAKEMAMNYGAISCGAYTTDPEVKEKIMDEMSLAGTPVSFNLTGGIYVNQNASFSDFHVTGGNPAGNASFTNPEFVIKRFTWVGFREPVAG